MLLKESANVWKLSFSQNIREREFSDSCSEKTKFYIDVFVETQVQGLLEWIFWLTFLFQLNFYNNRIYICCFAKFQLYRLSDGVIIIRKLNNGRLENAYLFYCNQFNQNTDNEIIIIPFERQLYVCNFLPFYLSYLHHLSRWHSCLTVHNYTVFSLIDG